MHAYVLLLWDIDGSEARKATVHLRLASRARIKSVTTASGCTYAPLAKTSDGVMAWGQPPPQAASS